MDEFKYFLKVAEPEFLDEIDKYLYGLGYKKYDILTDTDTADRDYTVLIDEIGFKNINQFDLAQEYLNILKGKSK